MNRILAATLIAAAAPLCAFAQTPDRHVARLAHVAGSVLVSNDHDIAAGGPGLRLVPGMRILVTPNSRAEVEYADGCRVRLAPGERFEVAAVSTCPQRTAALELSALAARSDRR